MDWLRDASVNLMTLELGRWIDVQVVYDKKVGDLLRTLPDERRRQMTLSDGLALARRAGAGTLVMGDFTKAGKGARLSASVFDVRSGTRARTVEQRPGDADSLLAAFGQLSRDALGVPPPPNSHVGEPGTANLDAYRAYLGGVRALNRWDLDSGIASLQRAVRLDSTFALPHLFLSIAYGWLTAADSTASISHALTAQRLGASLPPRERVLAATAVEIARSDYGAACRTVAPLVARDSSDVLALYLMGDCAYHDNTVIAGASDTAVGTKRYSWNLSLGMLRRALQLDPSFHVAFEHIVDILRSAQFIGCAQSAPEAPCVTYSTTLRRDGDSLVLQPVNVSKNRAEWDRQVRRATVEQPLRANLNAARRIASDWLGADTTEAEARIALASVLLSLGEVDAAEAQWKRVPSRLLFTNGVQMRKRMETAIKGGNGVLARAWFDSLVKLAPDDPARPGTFRGSMELVFARGGRLHAGLDTNMHRTGQRRFAEAEAQAYMRAAPALILGLPRSGVAELEAAFLGAMIDTARCTPGCRAGRLTATLEYALRAPRTQWPAFLGSMGPTLLEDQPAIAISKGDMAALRVAAQKLDSSSHARVASLQLDDAHGVVGAEAYLALGDSARALSLLRFVVDSVIPISPVDRISYFGMSHAVWWMRAWLQRAQLAAAANQLEEARKWYDRVLDMWATADAEFAPDVARIKKERAALGGQFRP